MGREGSLDLGCTETSDDQGIPVAEGTATPDSIEWDTSLNLLSRLVKAQASAKTLDKTEKANGLKYDYVSHDSIASEASRVLTAHGILFFPTIDKIERDGNNTIIHVQAAFYNADDMDQKLVTQGVGYGIDNQDKGPGKAYSYACKYILAKVLLLNTSDDIEKHDIDYNPAENPEAIAKSKETAEKAVTTWANAFKAAITGCDDYYKLKSLQTDNAEMLKSSTVPEAMRDFFNNEVKDKLAVLKPQKDEDK